MAVNRTLSTWSHAIPYLWQEFLTDETKGRPIDNNYSVIDRELRQQRLQGRNKTAYAASLTQERLR